MACAPGKHAGQCELGADQHSPGIDVEDRIGDRVVLVGESAGRHDARIVDQHRERCIGRVDRIEKRREGLPGADVLRHPVRPDPGGGRGGQVGVEIADEDVRSVGCEGFRGGQSDAARATGDRHASTLQPEGLRPAHSLLVAAEPRN